MSISHVCGSVLAATQGSRFERLRVPHTGLGCHFQFLGVGGGLLGRARSAAFFSLHASRSTSMCAAANIISYNFVMIHVHKHWNTTASICSSWCLSTFKMCKFFYSMFGAACKLKGIGGFNWTTFQAA